MGYSHYMRIKQNANLDHYAAATAALSEYLRRVASMDQIQITGWDGERSTPIEDAEFINFNGVGRESCENFIWYKARAQMIAEDRLAGVDFGDNDNSVFFCTKTRQKAYDRVVLGAMVLVKYYLKADAYIASDGGDWAFNDGVNYLREVFKKELEESEDLGGEKVFLGLSSGITEFAQSKENTEDE